MIYYYINKITLNDIFGTYVKLVEKIKNKGILKFSIDSNMSPKQLNLISAYNIFFIFS